MLSHLLCPKGTLEPTTLVCLVHHLCPLKNTCTHTVTCLYPASNRSVCVCARKWIAGILVNYHPPAVTTISLRDTTTANSTLAGLLKRMCVCVCNWCMHSKDGAPRIQPMIKSHPGFYIRNRQTVHAIYAFHPGEGLIKIPWEEFTESVHVWWMCPAIITPCIYSMYPWHAFNHV